MREALSASRSRYFPREYDKIRTVKLILGAISLAITGLLLMHSVREFITFRFIVAREINELSYIVFIFVVAAIFYALILAVRKIYKRGYVFKLSVSYNDAHRKYINLERNPSRMVFNEGNNRLYIATKESIIVFDDSLNDIVEEIAIKNTGYMAVDHVKDILFVTLERGIAVIDTSSNTLIKNIFEECRFGQLCINFNTNMLYAINLDFHCVYIIECSSQTLIDKIYCDSYPRAVTVNPNTNSIYMGNSNNIVTIIDGYEYKAISRIHLPNPPDRWYGSSKRLDELYVDASNNILYVKEAVIGPANEGGCSLQTLFFKLHLNSIRHHEYFIHDFECDIIPKTERYTPYHESDSTIPKYDTFERNGSLDDSFTVNSKSGLLYLTDIGAQKLEEIDSNNKILRTFVINQKSVSIAMNPIANNIYLANSGYFSNWIDIIYLQKDATINPPLSIENSSL